MAVDVPPIRGIGITDTYHPINYDTRESVVYIEEDVARMKINAVLICADGQRFIFDDAYDAECFNDKREKSLKALRAAGYVPV
jgi:hypothetical protein